MRVVNGRQSLWIYTLLVIALLHWEELSASTSPPTLPPPKLDISSQSRDSVSLVCRAPEGHSGLLFMLYRYREKVDSKELQSSREEVQFTLRLEEGDSVQSDLYCCLYKTQDGRYSAFSPYLQLQTQEDAVPTRSAQPLPPPVLSVQPSTGVVKQGDMLSFRCSVPTSLPQARSQSTNNNNNPMTFILLRTAEQSGPTSDITHPRANWGSYPEPQPGLFTVGPVKGGEEGFYTCFYQVTHKKGVVNSTVSNIVQITVTDALPMPTLVLHQQTDIWHLLCTGSPAYPGAAFSLYLADNELPVNTQQATLNHHQASFPVPVQDTPVALYHCRYSVFLEGKWHTSERSLPLALNNGIVPPSSSPDASVVDWPLVLGSFSAVVLFLCSVALMAVGAYRKVKAATEAKKKRQDAQFWTQVHAKDHVVDLTLRRSSFISQEWASVDTATETASRSPLWNSLSTFTTPIHPIH